MRYWLDNTILQKKISHGSRNRLISYYFRLFHLNSLQRYVICVRSVWIPIPIFCCRDTVCLFQHTQPCNLSFNKLKVKYVSVIQALTTKEECRWATSLSLFWTEVDNKQCIVLYKFFVRALWIYMLAHKKWRIKNKWPKKLLHISYQNLLPLQHHFILFLAYSFWVMLKLKMSLCSFDFDIWNKRNYNKQTET